MNSILKLIALVIRNNAISGAGAASVRGMHEVAVPDALKKAK